jgi:ribosomal protein L14
MIQNETNLVVADNSGARSVRVIPVYLVLISQDI